MDPNKCYTDLIALMQRAQSEEDPNERLRILDDIAENFEALDNWMKRGGFPPREWNKRPKQQPCPCPCHCD